EHRGELLYFAQKLCCGPQNGLPGDMLGGKGPVHLGLQIIGGGGGPQDKAARIFLVLSLELRDFLGEFSRTDDQQSSGQRVQGTGMADFEFLEVEFLADGPFQGVDRLEGTPFQGFVDQDELTFQYSFLVDQKKFLWSKDTDLSPNAPPHGDRSH